MVKIRHNAHFSLKTLEMLKTRLHSTRTKRKRYYDVTLSRQEGSTMRHLASAQYWDRVYADRISNCALDRMY